MLLRWSVFFYGSIFTWRVWVLPLPLVLQPFHIRPVYLAQYVSVVCLDQLTHSNTWSCQLEPHPPSEVSESELTPDPLLASQFRTTHPVWANGVTEIRDVRGWLNHPTGRSQTASFQAFNVYSVFNDWGLCGSHGLYLSKYIGWFKTNDMDLRGHYLVESLVHLMFDLNQIIVRKIMFPQIPVLKPCGHSIDRNKNIS